MNKKIKVERSVLWHGVGRIFKWIPILVGSFVLVAFTLFQTPKIQTKILNETSAFIAKNTSFRLTIGHANLTWYDEMLLDEVRLFQVSNDSTLLEIDHVSIDFGLLHYFYNKEIKADQLIVSAPQLHIIKPNDSTMMNINLFVNELKSVLDRNEQKKKTNVYIDEIEIQSGVFSFNQLSRDSTSIGKDFKHFTFNNLNGQISQFVLEPDSIGMHIDSLMADDPDTSLDIKFLSGDFNLTQQNLGLTKMSLLTQYSHISDSIVLSFKTPTQLKYFADSVEFKLNLDNSLIDSRDLALFSQKLGQLNYTFDLSGKFDGSLNKVTSTDLNLQFGNTKVKGSGYFNGLPVFQETFIDFNFVNSSIDPLDIENVVPRNIMDKLQKIGRINLNGSFSGFPTNFVAAGEIDSKLGFIHSDINLRIDQSKMAHYAGKITLNNFLASEMFEEIGTIKNISLNGEIKGKGLNVNNANFDLNAKIDSVEFLTFSLNNISTVGHFEKQFLNADFNINDPKLKFFGAVEVDIRTDQNKFRIDANIDTLDLYSLGYTRQPLMISSELDVNMKGLKIDEMKGFLNMTNSRIIFKQQKLAIDSISLLSTLIGKQREIHLTTDDLTAQLKGEYTNDELFKSLGKLYKEIRLHLENDSTAIQDYYNQKKVESLTKLNAELNIKLRNLNQYIQPFYPEFHISNDVHINSRYDQDSINSLAFHTNIDSIRINDHSLYSTVIDLDISKNHFDKEILASLTLESPNQEWSKDFKTEDLSSEIILDKNQMTFWSTLQQPQYNNNIVLNGEALFKNNYTLLHMLPTSLRLLDKRWKWSENNEIRINKENLVFKDFGLANNNQKIEVNGIYGVEKNESVEVVLELIELKNIQTLIPFNLEGIIDGNVNIKKGVTQSKIDGHISARDLKVKDFLVGNLFVNTEWDHDDNALSLDLNLIRNEERKIEIKGTLFPQSDTKQLDLKAEFFDSDLKILEPILYKNFSSIKGVLTGKTTITGMLNSPKLNGNLAIQNGQVKVNYLNTTYKVNGNIVLSEKSFITNNLTLIDTDGNTGVLSGDVSFTQSNELNLNVTGQIQKLKILNTNSIDNELYYGTAFATGTVKFQGSANDLIISASAKSEKGTKLSFPINQNKNFKSDQKEYIQFINLQEKEKSDDQSKNVIKEKVEKIKGIRLDLDLELTQDAYIEMIFDIKSGDIIRGRGDGNLNLLINTDGDFSMLGDYSINQGGYNFTLYNIINKEFTIKKGGTIAWYGNPYGAILNIEAQYRQLTSLLPILTDLTEAQQNSIEFRKKYYSVVELKLTEDLLTPDIKFDINIEDYPREIRTIVNNEADTYPLESHVNAFKTKIRNNEQEMNRQVFSLLILRKFSPENSFQVNSGTIGSSLSEFVSNQLSYWATQVDENLEIDVDLASLNEDAFNTFQLRLSYTFMDGRLKVTRGGGIPTEQNNENIYSFIGDWSVEYLLTRDGRFRAKVYSRADVNASATNQQTNPNRVETGFSLQFIRSFDQIKDILRDSRKKNMLSNTDESVN